MLTLICIRHRVRVVADVACFARVADNQASCVVYGSNGSGDGNT